MEPNKLYFRIAHVMLWGTALLSIISLFTAGRFDFSPEMGRLSIFSSKGAYMAYHIWTIIISLFCSWNLYKMNRGMFLLGVLILIILMFYPWMTSGGKDAPAPTPAPAAAVDSSGR